MASEHNPRARFTDAEVVVPGTPEVVWHAIATGSGTAAWGFAVEVEAREGGAMVIRREPFSADAAATVTAWDPPHRLAYEEPIQAGSAEPLLATEFLVEARDGGTCIVRVVSGLHHHGEGWEDLVEGAGQGWQMALAVLRSYLTHFVGQPASRLDVISVVGQPVDRSVEVFATLVRMLGLSGPTVGDPFRTPDGAPPLAGVVEHVTDNFVLLRAGTPCPGLIPISTLPMDGVTLTVNVSGRLYGPDAGAVAQRDQPRWKAWLSGSFPDPVDVTR